MMSEQPTVHCRPVTDEQHELEECGIKTHTFNCTIMLPKKIGGNIFTLFAGLQHQEQYYSKY